MPGVRLFAALSSPRVLHGRCRPRASGDPSCANPWPARIGSARRALVPGAAQYVALIDLAYANEEWAKLHRPSAVQFLQKRLAALSNCLGDKPYLDGDRFTAGDLMMTTVLRMLRHTDIVASDPRLSAYIERCTACPAFRRAHDAQIGDFRQAA
jgi:glutathione S-transferase